VLQPLLVGVMAQANTHHRSDIEFVPDRLRLRALQRGSVESLVTLVQLSRQHDDCARLHELCPLDGLAVRLRARRGRRRPHSRRADRPDRFCARRPSSSSPSQGQAEHCQLLRMRYSTWNAQRETPCAGGHRHTPDRQLRRKVAGAHPQWRQGSRITSGPWWNSCIIACRRHGESRHGGAGAGPAPYKPYSEEQND
jgi:hypothetical protein